MDSTAATLARLRRFAGPVNPEIPPVEVEAAVEPALRAEVARLRRDALEELQAGG